MHTDAARAAAELAVDLVRIDSVNPALVPGAAGESAIVAHLAERLGAHGLDGPRAATSRSEAGLTG